MLPRGKKVERASFGTLTRTGRRLSGVFFSAVMSPADQTKVSFVIAKTVVPKAHDRNRHKRQGYLLAEKYIDFTESPFWKAVFYLKKGIATASPSEIESDFQKLVSEMQKYRGK